MIKTLKHLGPGLLLILLASTILLLSDLERRNPARQRQRELPRLAIMQWASTDLLDHIVQGIIEGLRHQGFEHGRTATITHYNAAGDVATANLMARELTGGRYDMLLTASTLALQAVAAANREHRIPHLFAGVTDPYGAGVGITGPAPGQHPPHLTGLGTFQPVEASIRIAREMNPRLRRLGTVWNPSESNSEACVLQARDICAELGIELIEANAGNTSEVPEALSSVIGRRVDAIWVGGDIVAIAAINSIIGLAKENDIPVFSNDPSDIAHGALFALGASYRQVGFALGDRAGQILRGAPLASFGVENLVPEVLALNKTLVQQWPAWTFLEKHHERARHTPAPATTLPDQPTPGRTYQVGLIYFGPNPIFETAARGLRNALEQAGFKEGENLILHTMHANNDISMLSHIVQRMMNRQPDLVIPLSTPCLTATLAGSDGTLPIVFGIVTAPLEAGAGQTFEDHLPHVTGAVWTAPAPESFDWISRLFPAMKSMGILYNPSHANSRAQALSIREQCAKRGWRLIERHIHSTAEVTEAMQALLRENPDVIFGMGENTVVSAFPSVANLCREARIPLIADDSSLMGSGALLSIGASPFHEGHHAGQIAARVLLGEDPATIPFQPSKTLETTLDFQAAKHLGLSFPHALLKQADRFLNLHARHQRPVHIAMINLVQSRVLDQAEEGVIQGLQEAGLVEHRDFTLRRYNAQGEISMLPALIDSARLRNPDLILTITTPALIAAAHHVHDIPIVYTVASNPHTLEIFTPDSIPDNLTGVHDDPPLDLVLALAKRHTPALKSVGIVYDPAQPNSVISVDRLRQATSREGITLHKATATSLTELAPAVQSLIQRGTDALILSADNLVTSGFAVIHDTANRAGIPIFTTELDTIEDGATGAIGNEYGAWGAQAGHIAAAVLAGLPPAEIPLQIAPIETIMAPRPDTLPP